MTEFSAESINDNPEDHHEEDPQWDGVIDDHIIAAREQEYNELTEEELKEELRLRELSFEGTKEELIARLMSDDFDEDDETHVEEIKVIEEDEFVEWNKDGDHEIADIDDIIKDSKELDDGSTLGEANKTEATAGENKTEGEAKKPEDDYKLDIATDKDLFYMTWHGNKLSVPFKGEISKDLTEASKLQSLILHPIQLVHLQNEFILKYLKMAITVNMELEETAVDSVKGYMRLKFKSSNIATSALDDLKGKIEGLTIAHYSREDYDVGQIMSSLKEQAVDERGPTLNRLVFIANIPAATNEKTISELFPGAEQIIFPDKKRQADETTCYAYAVYGKEEDAYEAADTLKDTQIDGNMLYVIKAITEKKEKYGLMADSSKVYFTEQVRRIKKLLAHARDKEPWEIKQCESKLKYLEARLARDKRRREALLLAPSSTSVEERKKERLAKSPSPSRDRKRSKSPKRSSNRKSDSRISRSTTQYESRSSRPDGSADRLVHQLQGIVSALSDKLPGSSPPRSSRGTYRGDYPSDNKYRGSGAPRRSYPRFPRYTTSYTRDQYAEDKSGGYPNSNSYSTSYSRSYASSRTPRSTYRGATNSSSDRYAGAKRSREEDGYSSERKRRIGDYLDQSSSSRYGPSSRDTYESKYLARRDSSYSSVANGQSYNSRSRGRAPRGSYSSAY